MGHLPLLVAALALGCSAINADAACFDVSKSEPHRLSGLLAQRTENDGGELNYILKLSEPICLTGDKNAAPEKMISEVQVFATEKTRDAFRALANSKVTVELSHPVPAETGLYTFMALVTNIFRADYVSNDDASAPVKGFYQALARGNGDEAASLIVPESRKGPISAEQMSRFYGDLVSPLELLSVQPNGSDTYLVHYQFRSSGGQCDGRAIVKTVKREGVNLISNIRALDGC
jgi:hypothetical protein